MDDASAVIAKKLEEARTLIELRIEEIAAGLKGLGLDEVVSYISKGGKRLRGFLSIITCEALGGRAEDAVDTAVATELVHSASLALDDIVDQDVVRRGSPSAWVLFGIGKTAMISLFLVPLALKLVERYGRVALGYSIQAWEETVRGEIADAYPSADGSYDYLEVARLKTGSLFSLAAALGAVAASRPGKAEEAYRYGGLIGLSYQVADDLVDYLLYLGGERRKLDPSERLFERWVKESLGGKQEDDLTARVLNFLRERTTEASMAAESLFPQGPYQEVMKYLPRFIVNSMLVRKGLSI